MGSYSLLIWLGIAWLVVFLAGYVMILCHTPSLSLSIMLLVFPPLTTFWVLMDKQKVFNRKRRGLWLAYALWAFLPVPAFAVLVMLYGTLEFIKQ